MVFLMHSGAGEERTMTCGTGEENTNTHTLTQRVILSDRVVVSVTSVRDQAGVLQPESRQI